MKKKLHISVTKSDKNIGRLSSLFLCLFLSISLSGQKVYTVLGEKWTSGAWVTDSRETNFYDVNGHLINSRAQSWNGVSWDNSFQMNYTIDPITGTTSQMVWQNWSASTWVDFIKISYTYNSSKQVLTETTEMLVLIPSTSKKTYTYVSGLLTNTLTQNWNGASWDDKTQSAFTNNSDGNPTLEVEQSWDGIQWNNSRQTTSTYNPSSKKIVTEVIDDWTISVWVPSSKDTYQYDGSGYLINTLSQIWDAGITNWKDDLQSNFENNSDGTLHIMTNQEWNVSVWVNTNKLTLSYDPLTGSADLRNEEYLTIYPNPASDIITIKTNKSILGSTYIITNQTGNLVLKGKLNDETTVVNITSLVNGVYFLRVGEKSQHAYKVIKNK